MKRMLIDSWLGCVGQINVLDSSSYKWLHELLEVFNRGDMHTYEKMCVQYSTVLNEQPALVENERKLKEKLTIMCLLELIFRCASHLKPDFMMIVLCI